MQSMDTLGSSGMTGSRTGISPGGAPLASPSARHALTRPVVLTFGLLGLFLYAHPYQGLRHDGLLYAMQALRELYPQSLNGDPFFRFGSQGQFTLFPAIYGAAIGHLGLESAAWLLSRTFAVLLCAAALLLARRLMERSLAWLALAVFIVVPGKYGAGGLFSTAEDFLTARPIAEALGLLGLWYAVGNRWRLSAGALGGAAVMHPLIAMPAMLCTLLLAFRRRWPLCAAVATAALLAAVVLAHLAPFGPLVLLDPEWHAIAARNTAYLFTDTWQLLDWQRTVVPLVTLAIARLVLPPLPPRRLAAATLVVGVAGVGLALLASRAMPVLLLIQGQPWRWVWVAKVVATLLLVPLTSALWSRGRNGRAVLALVLVSWMGAEDAFGLEAAACALAAALLAFGTARPASWPWLPAGLLAIAFAVGMVWLWAPAWILIAAAAAAIWWGAFRSHQPGLVVAATLAAVGLCGYQINTSMNAPAPQADFDLATRSFAGWQARVRPDQTVLFEGEGWRPALLLHRRSYLTAGPLIFSRAAALDAVAASERVRTVAGEAADTWSRPAAGLTDPNQLQRKRPSLAVIQGLCGLPGLDFVVVSVAYAMPRLDSVAAPPFDGLSLYDCEDLRLAAPHG